MGKLLQKKPVALHILEWLILLSPFLFGGFFPWTSAVTGIVLIGLLFYLLKRNALCLSVSPVFLTASAIVFFHLCGVLWGIDHGMALVGVVQFLPLPLFVLLLEQYEPAQRLGLLKRIPYVSSVMVILSFLLSRITALDGWFLVAGRQAGFFQYPNTYAIYLLFSVILVLFGDQPRFGPIPWLIVLLIGIVLSGSRTVFILLICVLFIFLLHKKDRHIILSVLGVVLFLTLFFALYTVFNGNRDHLSRFARISLSSSEFLGRLLYARDALPVILKHPFGLGYMGYHSLQGSFQTGVYSVQHIHNEFLQLLLDVGWIPAILMCWSIWRSFLSSTGGFCRKLLLLILLLHCMLDFDTQFISIALLLFLVMDTDKIALRPIKMHIVTVSVLALFSFSSVWIGAASFAYYLRDSDTAVRIYPEYTAALTALLPNADIQEMDHLSDRILNLNSSIAVAHNGKARSSFHSGNYDSMLFHKQEAVRLSRYNLNEYLDYFDLLRINYERCLQTDNADGARQYLDLMMEIPEMLKSVKEQTSSLGWRINDKPKLDLPAEYISWLNTHRIVS